MRKLKYVLIFFLILLILALIPWINGYLFKQNYLALLAALSEQNKTRIKVLEYHEGWLSSRVKIYAEPVQFDPSVLSQAQNLLSQEHSIGVGVTIEQEISHGPIVYDSLSHSLKIAQAEMISHVHLPSMIEMMLMDGDSNQGIMQIYTFTSFQGNFANHVEIPQLKLQIPGVINVLWTASQGDIYLSFNKDQIAQIKSQFNLGSLSVQYDSSSLSTKPISITENITFHPIGLWSGSYALLIPELSINDKDMAIQSSNLNLQTTFGVNADNLYNSAMDLSIARLTVPQYDIQSAVFKLSLNDLNPKTLLEMINLSYPLLKGNQNVSDNMNKYMGLVPKLITLKSTISTNIAFNSNNGNFAVDAQSAWPANSPLPITINEIAAKANFQINARISAALVNQLIEWAANNQASSYTEPNVMLPTGTSTVKIVEKPQTTTAQNPPPPATEDMDQHIKRLSDEGKIPLDIAIQLQDLASRKFSAAIFAQNVDRFVITKDISPETASDLKAKYVANDSSSPAPLPPQEPVPPQEQVPAVSVVTTAEVHEKALQDMKQQVEELVKKGYLIQDQNDYVFSAIREQGVLKINGKDASSLAPLEIPIAQ